MRQSLSFLLAPLLLAAAGPLQAAFDQDAGGARALGLGRAYIGAADDASGPLWNPASLSRAKGEVFYGTYQPPATRARLGPQNDLIRGAFSVVSGSTTAVNHYGVWWAHLQEKNARRENTLAGAFAHDFGPAMGLDTLSVGFNLKYMNSEFSTSTVRDRSAAGLDLGVLIAATSRARIGAVVRDVTRPRLAANDQKLPAKWGVGAGFQPGALTLLAMDVAQEENGVWKARGGLEQGFGVSGLVLRAGAGAYHSTWGAGLRGVRFGSADVSVDYTYSAPFNRDTHDALNTVSLRMRWGGGPRPRRRGSKEEIVLMDETEQAAPTPESGEPKRARRGRYWLSRSALIIGPEDVLQVQIKNQPELEATATVDSWGYVRLPFIGDIKAAGGTAEDLGGKLEDIYSDFVNNPQVNVRVAQYNSRVVYVLGHVRNPGRYPMLDRLMTIRDAVVAAGLPRESAALWRAFVVRQTESGPDYIHVNLDRVLHRGHLENNIILRPGDTVYLPPGILDAIAGWIGRITAPIFGTASSLVIP